MDKTFILIIDDTPINLKALNAMLSTEHTCLIAKTAQAGLQLAQGQHIDLVLLDLFMPGMDGFEALERLKDNPQTREIPVIIVSGSQEPDDEVRCFELGCADYIRKPFHDILVRTRVRMHLDYARLRKQNNP